MTPLDQIRTRYEAMSPFMDERLRRLWAGAEAMAAGPKGITLVAAATGLHRHTVAAGRAELEAPAASAASEERIRKPGAGRPKATERDPGLKAALEALIEPATRGDPESPLRWVSKSTQHLATVLIEQGHPVGRQAVGELLHDLGFSLQANRKTLEGAGHPDRNAQFEYINEEVKAFQAEGQPVVSVDAKKKELVGNFKNGGREWNPKGEPERVNVYDFVEELGRATPYGIYDIKHNEGWVSVGTDHDTAAFAVESIRSWWESMGRARYPSAKKLLITADGGGSNSRRSRLWKRELAALAEELNLEITVSHLPPGTSKWNKIEHRMFSFISMNWRGQPLTSHEIIVSLIGGTRTEAGLHVQCELDINAYPTGIKVTDEEMENLNIRPHAFHGEWNYTLSTQRVESQ